MWGNAFSDRLAGRRPHTLPAKISHAESPTPLSARTETHPQSASQEKMNYGLGTSFILMPVMVWGLMVPGEHCGADGWLFAGSITVDFMEFWTTYWIPE